MEWTTEKDDELRALRKNRVSIRVIAARFGTNRDIVRRRMSELGLPAFVDESHTLPIATPCYRPGIDPRPKVEN